MVRFRLKKSLPFDVDKAKVSYHAQKTNDGVRVVAAVALASVLEDYEAAFRDAGFSPGVVLPSMLAALGVAEGQRPTLVVKVDARTTSIAILNGELLQLFRTLENTRGVTITGEQLAEEVYPSVVFFQDTYHLNIEKIFVAGFRDIGSAAPALQRADRRGSAGTGEFLAVGSEQRRIGAALENGRGGGSFDFVGAGVRDQGPGARRIY